MHRQGVVDLEEEEGKNSNTWPLLGTGEIANSVGIPELGIGRGYGTRDRFLEKVEQLSQD